MNKLLITSLVVTVIAGGCTEDDILLQPNDSSITPNAGTVSAAHFSAIPETYNPDVIDATTGAGKVTTVTISIRVGDRNDNQLTDAHTIYFRSEYGLIEPSCTTRDGTCDVDWTAIRPPSDIGLALDGLVDITAYTVGEEAFIDNNDNGVFDDGDTFTDLEEPFVDVDASFVDFDPSDDYTAGDLIIDVVSVNDVSGNNGAHDGGDGLYNGPGCAHSTLCSPRNSIMLFEQITLDIVQ